MFCETCAPCVDDVFIRTSVAGGGGGGGSAFGAAAGAAGLGAGFWVAGRGAAGLGFACAAACVAWSALEADPLVESRAEKTTTAKVRIIAAIVRPEWAPCPYFFFIFV